MLLSTTIPVLVSVAAGLGLVLTSGDGASVTAATPPTTLPAEVIDTTPVAAPTTPSSTVATTTTSAPTTGTTVATVTPPPPPVAPAVVTPAVVATTTAPAATLTAGSPSAEVAELQRQLNAVTGSTLTVDGLYGAGTTAAVKDFQSVIGVAATGAADPVTRWKLAEAAATPASPSHLSIGAGGANGCQVAVVGDSLMAGAEELTISALSRVGCAAAVDGEGGRSLAYGWQCRVERRRSPAVDVVRRTDPRQ